MNSNERKPYESYYLSNFKKYTKKVYRFGELTLPQPIRIKVFLIFITTLICLIVLRFIPFLNLLVKWIPELIYFVFIPLGIAYLLAEFREENRSVIKYFKSYTKYKRRKKQNEAFVKGRIINMNEYKKE